MPEILSTVLVAALAVAGVTGAIIAALRMIPHKSGAEVPTARLESLESGLEALRLSLAEIADHYEITTKRNATRVGKLRRKVARLQGDDEDEDEEVEPAPVLPGHVAVPCAPVAMSKLDMHRAWMAKQASGGQQ